MQSFHFLRNSYAISYIWLFEFDFCHCKTVCLVVDAAVNMDGNVFVEGSSFDEVLFDLADQLSDSGAGEFLSLSESCYCWSLCTQAPQLPLS